MDERDQVTRILHARLHGTVHHHVRINHAQDAVRDVALEAVAGLVDGRPDRAGLLAEIAGIMLGAGAVARGHRSRRTVSRAP